MIPPQLLLSIALVATVVIVAFYGFTSRNYLVHLLLVATPVFVFLINNPGVWMALILGLNQSGLIFPGIPQGLQVVHVMMAGFSLLILARAIILKSSSRRMMASDYWLFAFLLVLVVTIAVRGFGLRALGSESWGGMGYVKLFLTAGFLFAARQISLTPAQLKLAIVLMLVLNFLPVAAELIFLLSGGTIYQQYMFVAAHVSSLVNALNVAETGRGVARFVMLSGLSAGIYMLALILFPMRGVRRFIAAFLILVALVAAGLSGFRTAILNAIGTIGLFLVLMSETGRLRRALTIGAAGILILLLLLPFVSHLTPSMQRSLSWIPFLDIPLHVKMDAYATTIWRIEVWKLAWAEVPRYLWIGKGFAIDPMDMQAMSTRMDSVLAAFLAHNYHSGPLTLLLDLGIFGFIAGTGFMFTSAWEVYKVSRTITGDPFIRRFYIFFLAQYLYGVPSYFLIFGDVRESLSSMFITVAILHVAANTSRELVAAEQRKQPAPALVPHARVPPHGARLAKKWSPA